MKRTGALSAFLFIALPISAAVSENTRSIALVVDASGSMKARLPDGATRIEAAKAAIADVIVKLPAETRVALRVYGHQSPTQRRDCKDTPLLVPFDSAANNKSAVLEASRGVQAQGYTPITYVLKLAAQDLARESASSALSCS
jgi:Ca-activated chloride channel family protein